MRSAQPPLRGPALEDVYGELMPALVGDEAACKGDEDAWEFAVQAGLYEQLVRCMDSHASDADVQSLCCSVLETMAHPDAADRECWAGHLEAAVRAGAVRAVVAALRAHGRRNDAVLFFGACALDTMVTGDGPALSLARDGRAAEALAAGLPLALRSAAAGNARTLASVLTLLSFLVCLDVACAQQAARPGTLGALAEALGVHGNSPETVKHACFAMSLIVKCASTQECAAAADACVAALRPVVATHDDLCVSLVAWNCMEALLRDNRLAAKRAAAAGLGQQAVRTLRVLFAGEQGAADDLGFRVAAQACYVLSSVLEEGTARSRNAVHAEGAGPAIVSMLRAHGAASDILVAAGCEALVCVLQTAQDDWFAGESLRLVADVTAVMREHHANVRVQAPAVEALACLTLSALRAASDGTLDAAYGAANNASDLARRLADAGALEAAAGALQAFSVDELQLRDFAIATLVVVCSGAAVQDTGPPLQACVAARAARAGVGTALAAALAQAPVNSLVQSRAVALVAALAEVPPPRACDGCGAVDAPELKRCGRCRSARFCSVACQRAAWPAHKTVCVPVARATADDTHT